MSTSTYKRYSDVEYQWNESMLKSELTKPYESFDFEIQLEVESEKSAKTPTTSTPNASIRLEEEHIRKMISEEFNLDESNLSDTFILLKSICDSEDLDIIAEAIVFHGDREVLIN